MPITIDADELDSLVRDGALLVGLLEGRDPQPLTLNEGWFEHPAENIRDIPRRPEALLNLLEGILKPPNLEIPSNGNSWYPVRKEGDPTGLYMVLPGELPKENSTEPALLGAGLWMQLEGDGITITPSVHLPLFALTAGRDPRFVFGKQQTPLEVSITVESEESFRVGGKTFNTLRIGGSIFFDGTNPTLQVSFSDKSDQPPVVFRSLKALYDRSAEDWIQAILDASAVEAWLNKEIGSSEQTPGTVLVDLGILEKVGGDRYKVADLRRVVNGKPLACVQALIFDALKVLAEQDKALIPVGEGGIYIVKKGEAEHYGIRVCLPDIALTGASESGDNGKDAPQLKLQLGKWFTGEKEYEDSWLKRACKDCQEPGDPGIAVYLVERDNGVIAFKPRLELISVGLDFVGGKESSLVSAGGFELGGIEPRVYVALDFNDPGGVVHGYGARLDRLGIPLGTQFDKVGGKNPVASNLLASGGGEGGPAPESEDESVIPYFSASGSYVDDLSVQLYGPDDEQTDTVWFPVQRAFGPLSCKRVGVGWQDAERILSFLFDGSVSVDVLTIDLIGLSVGIPVTTPTELSAYTLGLHGLAVDVSAGPVQISGGLVETIEGDDVSYKGQALIKTETFAISAYGAYSVVDKSPSLFIFALVDYPLGGPPCFFVMGLAAGFGYNSSVRFPSIEGVQEFPLLAAMTDLGAIGGSDATPGDVLASLDEWIRPTRGSYWLAAGVSFSSFEIINSNVVAVIEFGKEFQVAVMGLSTIKLPQKGHAYAYAELMIQILVKPAEGVISAMALLSPNSYVIDPACHLTGGFAFVVWFGDSPYAGDFVLTIGGYHPSFQVPDHYPQVPRLGFNWAVSNKVTIKGDAYFALTPSAVMVGGGLEVLYHSGNLKAWFIARADVIIYWKPFYFEAGISVRIGVSYRLKIWFVRTTLKVELGASVELWGPPTGGKARISWFIISFTVSFGEGKDTGARAVDWDGFKTMLPQKDDTDAAAPRALVARDAGAERAPTDRDLAVIQININDGLLQQVDGDNGKKRWIIRPDEFAFSFETAIPATEVWLEAPEAEGQVPLTANRSIGIRPMGIGSITSSRQRITITLQEAGEDVPLSFDEWDYEPHTRSVPKAMWGGPVGGNLEAEPNLVHDCLVGVKKIRHKPHAAPSGPPKFEAEKAFTYFRIDLPEGGNGHPEYPLSTTATEPDSGFPTSNDSLTAIRRTLVAGAVRKKRTAVFEALADLGVNAWTDGDLGVLAAIPAAGFQASPMTGAPVPEDQERRACSG